MNNINKRLSRLPDGFPSKWKERVEFRRKNRDGLKRSAIIALKVLNAQDEQGLTQKALAAKMKVSPQQISKSVKGHENLTLETITGLELALSIKIIADAPYHNRSAA